MLKKGLVDSIVRRNAQRTGDILLESGFSGCIRLPIPIDADRLQKEIEALPDGEWNQSNPGPVVLSGVRSVYAIGYQSATRPNPPEDRPAILKMPYLRQVLRDIIPAKPVRARIACLEAEEMIPIHTDSPRDHSRTIRLSIQVHATGPQRFFCDGLWYNFNVGDVWLIDNLRPHGIANNCTTKRTTVIADYQPSPELMEIIAGGEQCLGLPDVPAQQQLESITAKRHKALKWAYVKYGLVKLWRRHVSAPAPD